MPNSGKFTGSTNLPIEGVEYESPQEGFISSDRMYTLPKLENITEVNWIQGTPVLPDNGVYKRLGSVKETRVSIAVRTNNGSYTAIKPLPHEPVDEHWDKVSLLMKMDGGDGSAVFVDSGPLNIPLTAFGTSRQTSSVKKFGESSYIASDKVSSIRSSVIEPFHFGSEDFTIEFWMKNHVSVGGDSQVILGNWSYGNFGWNVTKANANIIFSYTTTGSNQTFRSFSNVLSALEWRHVAICRHGNTLKLYLNGLEHSSSYTITGSIYPSLAPLSVGNEGPGSLQPYGLASADFDELRITKGVARYTENFTVIDKPFPVHAPFPDYQVIAFPANYGTGNMSRLYDKDLNVIEDVPCPTSAEVPYAFNTSMSRDRKLVAFGTPSMSSQFPVFNYDSWDWVGNPSGGNAVPTDFVNGGFAIFSPTNDILVLLESTSIAVYNTVNWNLIHSSTGNVQSVNIHNAGNPCWSPDGSKLFYITTSSLVRYIDLTDPSNPAFHDVNDTSYSSHAILHTDQYLLSVGGGNMGMRAWGIDNYSGASTILAPSTMPANLKKVIIYSPDKEYIVVGLNNVSEPLCVFEASTMNKIVVGSPPIEDDASSAQGGIDFSPDMKFLFMATTLTGSISKIYKYSVDTWEIVDSFVDPDGTGYGYPSLKVLHK